jgi:hypothetical protein
VRFIRRRAANQQEEQEPLQRFMHRRSHSLLKTGMGRCGN